MLNAFRIGCSKPHDAEVADVLDMPGNTFPGEDAVLGYADANCPPQAEQFLYPSENNWNLGLRSISCLDE